MGALRGRLRGPQQVQVIALWSKFVEQSLEAIGFVRIRSPLGLRNSLEGAAKCSLASCRDLKGIEFKVGHCGSGSEL